MFKLFQVIRLSRVYLGTNQNNKKSGERKISDKHIYGKARGAQNAVCLGKQHMRRRCPGIGKADIRLSSKIVSKENFLGRCDRRMTQKKTGFLFTFFFLSAPSPDDPTLPQDVRGV